MKIVVGQKFIRRKFTSIKVFSSSDIRSLGTAMIEFQDLEILLSNENSFVLYVIEEADDLLEKSQSYIFRLICKHEKNLKFIFICNNYEKLIKEIQNISRIYYFQKLEENFIKKRFEIVLEAEKIKYNKEALLKIIEKINGDMRQGLNYLQSIAIYGEINLRNYNLFFDIFNPLEKHNFLDACKNLNLNEMMRILQELDEEGYNSFQIIEFFEKMIYSYKEKSTFSIEINENDIYSILKFNQNLRLRLLQFIQSQKKFFSDGKNQIYWICISLFEIFKKNI